MIIGLGIGIPFNLNQISRLYSPLSLFANGEQGAWYDPSDLSTLYQDAAGTTPVTAVEQPVALMLDKSKGLVLGPELVTNGDFSSGTTGWTGAGTSPAALTVVSGELVQTSTAVGNPSFNGAEQIITTTAGKWYTVTGFIRNGTSTDVRLRAVNGTYSGTVLAESAIVTATVATQVRLMFLATSTTTSIYLRTATTGPRQLSYFDNISVRELPGAHAFQTTATSRPVLSARVNLLTKTEQFDDAVWAKSSATVTANAAIAPDGTLTGDKLVMGSGVGPSTATSVGCTQAVVVSNGVYRYSIFAKAGEFSGLRIRENVIAGSFLEFDLLNGVAPAASPQFQNPTIISAGNGWYNCSWETPTSIVNANKYSIRVSGTGDGTSGIYIWGASLVPTNQSELPYQRVNTATDYDAGPAFPRYLRCDGIDDGMVTSTITPGTDKAQVFAGVRKLSDATVGVITEFSVSASPTNPGSFAMYAPDIATGANYAYGSVGSLARVNAVSPATFSAPNTSIVVGISDISNDSVIVRLNGTQVAQNTTDQGTGNYLAYPLYLFRRAGTSLPFNGNFYGAVIRFGDNLPIETIQQTEAYMNSKTQAIDWRDITDSSSFRWNSATASPDAE